MSSEVEIEIAGKLFKLKRKYAHSRVTKPCESVLYNTKFVGTSILQVHTDKDGNVKSTRIE